MADRLSMGEIANIAGGLMDGKKDPQGARRLIEEMDATMLESKPLPSHLAAYLQWALKRIQKGYTADDAFGLTRPPNRPPRNVERDELIAFLMQSFIDRGSYVSEEAAAMAVRDYLHAKDPEFDLGHIRVRNIYRTLKKDGNPLVEAAFRLNQSRRRRT